MYIILLYKQSLKEKEKSYFGEISFGILDR